MALGRLTSLLVLSLMLPFVTPPYVPFEPAWEISAGLGYLACGAFIACCCLGWRRHLSSPVGIPSELDLHRLAGHIVWLATLGHVVVMLVFDPAVLEYLSWTMPWDIVSGLLASAALPIVVLTREPRRRPALRRFMGRTSHTSFTLLALALTLVHVALGQSKLLALWQVLVVLGVLAIAAAPSLQARLGLLSSRSGRLAGVRIESLTRRQVAWVFILMLSLFLSATATAHLSAWL